MAGLTLTVRLDDAALRRLTTDLLGDADRAVRRRTLAVEARARATAPRDTGLLANSHQSDFPQPLTGRVRVAAAYAAAVHEGSKPHDIVPKNGQALRFVTVGNVVFARRVHHPGAKGKPWLAEALAAERPAFERDVRDLLGR